MAEQRGEAPSAHYGDLHRYVARSMLSRQTFSEEELVELVQEAHRHYCPVDGTVNLNEALKVLGAVNESMSRHGYRIVKRLDERSGAHKFVLIIKELTEEVEGFEVIIQEAEMELLCKIVDVIMQNKKRRVSVSCVKRLESKSRLSRTVFIVDRWFSRGYLVYCEDRSFLTLGVTALTVLENYLVAEYHLPVCALCNFVVFTCSPISCCTCQKVYHVQCVKSRVGSGGDGLVPFTCPNEGCKAGTARLSGSQ